MKINLCLFVYLLDFNIIWIVVGLESEFEFEYE